jgi:hypothetical protein
MKFTRNVTGWAVACAIAAGSAMPVPAFSAPMRPVISGVQQSAPLDVTEVGNKRFKKRYKKYRKNYRKGFRRHGGHAYYNGHRGYRRHHRGYRRHKGYWFPPEAFILGAIIGSTIVDPPRRVIRRGLPERHVYWCDRKYRSYRFSDNSFQPYHGPRKQCASPYWP